MSKVTFNLLDNVFSHDKYSVAGRDSKFIDWDRNLTDKSKPTFYSHGHIPSISKKFTEKNNSYGLIFESRSICPQIYNLSEKYIGEYELFFTHNSEFLNKYNNCRWIPGGGVWIGGSYGKGEMRLFEKTKLCSLVSSKKKMCPLHEFRYNLSQSVLRSKVDVYGIDNWIPIKDSLQDYMFSIVVENFCDELYFTEKILNCFATGTVPIYFGAKKIGKIFDIEGIITFDNENQLINIINSLSPKVYYEKISAIKKNLEKTNEFVTIEDYIYKNYFQNVTRSHSITTKV